MILILLQTKEWPITLLWDYDIVVNWCNSLMKFINLSSSMFSQIHDSGNSLRIFGRLTGSGALLTAELAKVRKTGGPGTPPTDARAG